MASRLFFRGSAFILAAALAAMPVPAMAKVEEEIILSADGIEDYTAESDHRKAEPVNTNQIPGWPQGPAVSAAGAIVMDADSGEVLYGKNITKHLYPASITKIMTGLLAFENLKPTDTVTFSYDAVHSVEPGSSHIAIDTGESITVDEALYGLMVASANEVANGLGERVSGSQEAFADLMNERAKQLGCENTHFVTLNGLHDEDHYTCAYDMALIAREAFKHPELIEYMSKDVYTIPPSDTQPDNIHMHNTNRFLNNGIVCEDVIAGKTGYTDQARETLVSLAERDGMRLICVIMKDEPPLQYYDTIDLLNYAFENFKKVDLCQKENRFTLSSLGALSFGRDIFGNSDPAFRIQENSTLLIPKEYSFSDLDAKILPFMNYNSGVKAATESRSREYIPPEETKSAQEDGPAGTATDTDKKEAVPAREESQSGTDPSSGQEAPSSSSGQESSPLGFDETKAFTEDGSRILGTVVYSFHGYELATAQVVFSPKTSIASSGESKDKEEAASSSTAAASAEDGLPGKGSSAAGTNSSVPETVHGIRSLFFGLVHTGLHGSIYLNILFLLPLVLALSFVLCVFFYIHSYFVELEKRRRRSRRRAARSAQNRSPGRSSGRRK